MSDDIVRHPYSRMQREPLRPFEGTILRALDVAFLEAVRTGREQKGIRSTVLTQFVRRVVRR